MAVTGRDEILRATAEHVAAHGVTNQSLRQLAEAIGTSHRMLIYHFGSRDGLLTEVVARFEERQRIRFASLERRRDDPRAALLGFWQQLSRDARQYGPVIFELSAHAMQGHAHARRLRDSLIEPWVAPIRALLVEIGHPPDDAEVLGRLAVATVRGLLHDALLSDDFATADAAIEVFVERLLLRSPTG
ncbi:TetR/AcrR family transcriptional regulator [Propionibacteriaceae bacterium Y2011]|uniref:TetR/AcrR family transcriptional regulator n=1 Tax=Microlunatus sp. Y2014 TaxID=3418488 RepID=UPI003B4DE295